MEFSKSQLADIAYRAIGSTLNHMPDAATQARMLGALLMVGFRMMRDFRGDDAAAAWIDSAKAAIQGDAPTIH